MFCDKCGKENPNDAGFCSECGNPLAPTAEPESTSAPVSASKNSNLIAKIIKIAIPAVAAVILICILFSCLGGGYEKTFKNYFNANLNGNGKLLFESTVDPYLLEYWIDNDIYDSKADALDQYKENGKDSKENRKELEKELDAKIKMTYEIKRTYKFDKDEIEAVAEYLNDEYDYKEKDVKDIVVLKVKIDVSMGDEEYDTTEEIAVLKVKGKWYVNEDLGDKDDIEYIIERYE